ncbi:hypothetical protein ACSBR2_042481 [Camellia fascicularis]
MENRTMVNEEIKTIEAKVVQFYDQINQIQLLLQDDKDFNDGVHSSMPMENRTMINQIQLLLHDDEKSFHHGVQSSMSMNNRTMVEEEITVGFDDEALTIKKLLAGGKKQLQMISIVGMPRLGKTTLATKLYNEPYITHYFHTRAWTYASQLPRKTKMLLDILRSVNVIFTDEIENMTNEKLGEKLYRQLKGKRYLIVIDDFRDIGAWVNLKMYFPNDNKEVELCSLVTSKSWLCMPHLIAILIVCVFSLKKRVGSYYNGRCFKIKVALQN